MTKRQTRRNRWRHKAKLDQLALAKIKNSWMLSFDTWGGQYCPQCCRKVPPRFLATYTDIFYPEMIITLGGRCNPTHCVKGDGRYPVNQEFKYHTID